MKSYIQPATDIHPTYIEQHFMYSAWEEMGEEGQFAKQGLFDEEHEFGKKEAKEEEKWDKF